VGGGGGAGGGGVWWGGGGGGGAAPGGGAGGGREGEAKKRRQQRRRRAPFGGLVLAANSGGGVPECGKMRLCRSWRARRRAEEEGLQKKNPGHATRGAAFPPAGESIGAAAKTLGARSSDRPSIHPSAFCWSKPNPSPFRPPRYSSFPLFPPRPLASRPQKRAPSPLPRSFRPPSRLPPAPLASIARGASAARDLTRFSAAVGPVRLARGEPKSSQFSAPGPLPGGGSFFESSIHQTSRPGPP